MPRSEESADWSLSSMPVHCHPVGRVQDGFRRRRRSIREAVRIRSSPCSKSCQRSVGVGVLLGPQAFGWVVGSDLVRAWRFRPLGRCIKWGESWACALRFFVDEIPLRCELPALGKETNPSAAASVGLTSQHIGRALHVRRRASAASSSPPAPYPGHRVHSCVPAARFYVDGRTGGAPLSR